jgi:uncharacterized protein (TIGR00288 family)
MSTVAVAPYGSPPYVHAPNAALHIDFDNVTMGIRSDLGNELRNLLSSDIIKGKVAVQRAYADWRRYPQYIVPLAESSIDMIMAPAYGSSKKNATDIRLAVDAMELVFTRPEIGTYILLSGDSDFASLVTKLKEYGKYVIGVGIRESSSDLLVMNCDEYYSYNALAGLVKSGEEEVVKHDPWELVVEGVERMKRNGDVMRSDRLKQVMQEIDSTFDEKDLGMAKFSRFCQEAAQRGLIKVTRLENGQMDVDVAEPAAAAARPSEPKPQLHAAPAVAEAERVPATDENGRRGRRGRGRGRERERRPSSAPAEAAARHDGVKPAEAPAKAPAGLPPELTGERLTRDEALDLVRRAVVALTGSEDVAMPAAEVRRQARELLGRDSESLSERFFNRILSDAADAHLLELRKRGDVYEVTPVAEAEPAAVERAAATPPAPEPSQAARSAAGAASLRRGIRARGGRPGGRPTEVPPELLSIGVVETSATAKPSASAEVDNALSAAATTSEQQPESATQEAPAKRKRATRGNAKKATRTAAKKTTTKKAAKTTSRTTSRGRKAAASSATSEREGTPAAESSSQPAAVSSSASASGTSASAAASPSETQAKEESTTGAKSRRKRAGRKKSASKTAAAPTAGVAAAEGGEGSGV